MKRSLTTLCLVCLLLFSCASTAVASDVISIPSTLVVPMNHTPAEWYSTAYNRALFTVAASVDVATQNSLYMYDFSGPSYVGYQSNVIVAVYPSARGYISVFFHTDRPQELHYSETDWSESVLAELLIASLSDSYEENADATIMAATNALINALQ